MSTIVLERAYLPDGSATFGRWLMPDGWSCYTLERPWRGNERSVSCIPEGVYSMGMRESPVVRRTSRKRFTAGWEIRNVPGRTFIMVHPGNWPHNTEGCVLVGHAFSWHPEHGPMVTHSQNVFGKFMDRMADAPRWDVDVRALTVEYP